MKATIMHKLVTIMIYSISFLSHHMRILVLITLLINEGSDEHAHNVLLMTTQARI